jgi:hypothetical protein
MKPTPPSKKKTNPDLSKSDGHRSAGHRGDGRRSAGHRDTTQTYLKYSGLAFQLVATIGLAAWAGIELDNHLGNRIPWFTMLLVLLALLGSMIWLVRQLPKE